MTAIYGTTVSNYGSIGDVASINADGTLEDSAADRVTRKPTHAGINSVVDVSGGETTGIQTILTNAAIKTGKYTAGEAAREATVLVLGKEKTKAKNDGTAYWVKGPNNRILIESRTPVVGDIKKLLYGDYDTKRIREIGFRNLPSESK